MKRFLIISVLLHVGLFLIFSVANLGFMFRQPDLANAPIHVEFLKEVPVKKTLSKAVVVKPSEQSKPKQNKKEASPPPKPAPGIKTKVTAPEATKKKVSTQKSVPTKPPKVATNKKKPDQQPQKSVPVKPAKSQSAEAAVKKTTKPDPSQTKVQKPSHGIEKKKQEVESVDALLNTLLPDVGGTRDENAKKMQEANISEMPDVLENKAVDEIRSQIEAVWNYNPTEGIDFYLRIKIDRSGRILNVELLGVEQQNALQRAAAEAAYRSTLRLEQFRLDPTIFKPEHHEGGWGEIEVHFRPSN
jgi:outer membrane biosynthesis protein TonB